MNKEIVLSAENLHKTFRVAGQTVRVLNGISLTLQAGEFLAVTGPSGAGKSTLLHLLGGLEKPDSGAVFLKGRPLAALKSKDLNAWRNRHLGFVYQFHHLLPEFSALENVAMPLIIRRIDRKVAAEKAAAILEKVGLEHRLNHRPSELSGGERQRCAIARAMVGEPACILADEPTGNLDAQTASDVFALLKGLCEARDLALIIVTHDEKIAHTAPKRFQL